MAAHVHCPPAARTARPAGVRAQRAMTVAASSAAKRRAHSARWLPVRLGPRAYLAKGRSVISHLGRCAPKQAAKCPVHVALVAKPRLVRDVGARLIGFAQ